MFSSELKLVCKVRPPNSQASLELRSGYSKEEKALSIIPSALALTAISSRKA